MRLRTALDTAGSPHNCDDHQGKADGSRNSVVCHCIDGGFHMKSIFVCQTRRVEGGVGGKDRKC